MLSDESENLNHENFIKTGIFLFTSNRSFSLYANLNFMVVVCRDILFTGSFDAYLAGSKTGAFLYNLFDHFAVGILCFVVGKYLGSDYLTVAGIILFTHSAFDRILGYGLKYPDSFHNTHLGIIGHQQ